MCISPGGHGWTVLTTTHLKENKMFLSICKYITSLLVQDELVLFSAVSQKFSVVLL